MGQSCATEDELKPSTTDLSAGVSFSRRRRGGGETHTSASTSSRREQQRRTVDATGPARGGATGSQRKHRGTTLASNPKSPNSNPRTSSQLLQQPNLDNHERRPSIISTPSTSLPSGASSGIQLPQSHSTTAANAQTSQPLVMSQSREDDNGNGNDRVAVNPLTTVPSLSNLLHGGRTRPQDESYSTATTAPKNEFECSVPTTQTTTTTHRASFGETALRALSEATTHNNTPSPPVDIQSDVGDHILPLVVILPIPQVDHVTDRGKTADPIALAPPSSAPETSLMMASASVSASTRPPAMFVVPPASSSDSAAAGGLGAPLLFQPGVTESVLASSMSIVDRLRQRQDSSLEGSRNRRFSESQTKSSGSLSGSSSMSSFGNAPRVVVVTPTLGASKADNKSAMFAFACELQQLRRRGYFDDFQRSSPRQVQLQDSVFDFLSKWCCLWQSCVGGGERLELAAMLEHVISDNDDNRPLDANGVAGVGWCAVEKDAPELMGMLSSSHVGRQLLDEFQTKARSIAVQRLKSENDMALRHQPDEVLPGIFVCSYHAAVNPSVLATHNITAVVSCVGNLFPPTQEEEDEANSKRREEDERRRNSLIRSNHLLQQQQLLVPSNVVRVSGTNAESLGSAPWSLTSLCKKQSSEDDAGDEQTLRDKDRAVKTRGNVTYCNLELRDKITYRIDRAFHVAVSFLREMYLQRGCRVLIVCGAGMSRAATVTAAFLCDVFGLRVDTALALIRKARPQIRPNDAFIFHLVRVYDPERLPAVAS